MTRVQGINTLHPGHWNNLQFAKFTSQLYNYLSPLVQIPVYERQLPIYKCSKMISVHGVGSLYTVLFKYRLKIIQS